MAIAAVGVGLVAAGLAVPAFAATGPDPSPNIVGGHAPSQLYPGMASLQIDKGPDDPLHHTCGAALVSRRYVATAAHCVTAFPSPVTRPAALYHVRIGSPDRTTGGVLVGVEKILVHQQWNWTDGPGVVADVALLRLDTYVPYQQFEIADRLHPKATLRLLGWGVTEPSGETPLPNDLQELDTKILPAGRCADELIGVDEICVANPHGTDGACRGDSGGPALQAVPGSHPTRWAVVGGTIGGPHDCGTAPAIYADWTQYRDWMFQVMRTGQVPTPVPSGTPSASPTTSSAPAHAPGVPPRG